MTDQQKIQLYSNVRRLVAHNDLTTNVGDGLQVVDLASARSALAALQFPAGDSALKLVALVCSADIDGGDVVRLLREAAQNEELTQRLVEAGTPIDRVTFLTLFYEHVCAVLSTEGWRQLSSRCADGRVRAAHAACEIIEAALALGLMKCERIDSLLDLHELSVDAQHLLESEANRYPDGPVPLPEGMHWVRHGREAAELMRSPQVRLFFDYENRVGNYHTCYTDGTHFLGVNAEGVLFSFGWFRYPGEPVLTSEAVSPAPYAPKQL